MIKGLYEAHLPVCNLERSIPFYESLGLKLYKKYKKIAFFWIVENESWLGLWEDDEYKIPYHPASRHIAFRIEMDDLEQAIEWLNQKELWQKKGFNMEPIEPIVFPEQAHASVYFQDPDGNSLELIARLPAELAQTKKMYFSEWKKQVQSLHKKER